jgi:hypothetical protein
MQRELLTRDGDNDSLGRVEDLVSPVDVIEDQVTI